MLAWGVNRNIENSFKLFLDTEINSDSVTDENGVNIPVRVGRIEYGNWTLPMITLYVDSETDPKLFIGTTCIDPRPLIILDIYATNEGEMKDIANWLTQKIKSGFRYYSYTPSVSNPDNPTKVAGGMVSIETYLTNGRVNLGQNTDLADQHRWRITITTFISNS
jgi:hypothetical protein